MTTNTPLRARRLMAAATGAALLALAAPPAQAATACPAVDQAALQAPHAFRYGLTGSGLQQLTTALRDDGFRPRRVTGYLSGGEQRFATSWVKDGGPAWSGRFGLRGNDYTGSQKRFHTYFLEMRAAGYRPVDASGYNTADGDVRYAAQWERNTPHVAWRLHRDVSRAGMQQLVDTYKHSTWVPSRIEGYRLDGKLRFISIWTKRGCDFKLHSRMTRAQYQQRLDAYASTMRLVHLDSYRDGATQYYAGVWQRQSSPARRVRSNRGWQLFQRELNNNRCAGYVLDNAYATETANGVRYGGIWLQAGAALQPSASLAGEVVRQMSCAPGRAGAVVYNQMTGEQILVHPDQQFGTSSTIKSAILYALLRKVDREPGVTLATKLSVRGSFGSNGPDYAMATVREATCATSSTALRLRPYWSYSLRCLAQLMIRVSHNWATNRLIQYVGRAQINAELAAIGMSRTKLQRYMVGSGAPALHGGDDPGDDYMAGFDNLSTPRDMATFMRRMHIEGALPASSPLRHLTPGSNAFFWATLALDENGGTNAKGYLPGLLQALPSWTSLVNVFNKAGSNPWNDAPASKPGIGPHYQGSEAGRLVFANGQVAFYAMFVDEADRALPPARQLTGHKDALKCTGLAIVAAYSGAAPNTPAACS